MRNRRSNSTPPPVVLCLSNDTAHLNIVRRNLAQAGFSVVLSHSTSEVLDLIKQSVIDVIISDNDLQQTDGLSFYEKMKGKYGDKTPPTLVIGDNESDALESRCLALGTAGYHIKSDNMEQFIGSVTSIVQDDKKRFLIERTSARRRFKGGTDALTNVASKEHFGRRLNGESVAAYRDQSHLSLLMLVIDKFEKITDLYGQQKSNAVLAQTARLIEGELRSRDCVARYLENTFSVILPDTPIEAAAAVGRRLRRRISTAEFGDLDQPISLTVSVGATSRPPGTQITTSEIVSQALRASGGASMMGGDRVLADTALTGSPLVLVVGDPFGDIGLVERGLEDSNLEVRLATSVDEARKALKEVPVALVVAQQGIPGAEDGVDLLEWVYTQFPSVRRMLICDRVDNDIVSRAVNKAAIHSFVSSPFRLDVLSGTIDKLLFS